MLKRTRNHLTQPRSLDITTRIYIYVSRQPAKKFQIQPDVALLSVNNYPRGTTQLLADYGCKESTGFLRSSGRAREEATHLAVRHERRRQVEFLVHLCASPEREKDSPGRVATPAVAAPPPRHAAFSLAAALLSKVSREVVQAELP